MERLMLTQEQTTLLLLRNQLALTAFFASVVRSYHLAEDIFQEVCIAAISHDGGFESDPHLLNWARLAGRNRAIDALRARNGKYDGLPEDLLDRLSEAIHQSSLPIHGLKQDALRDCLQVLTPNNREILRLRYFEGKTSASIAERLERKVTTVYQSIARIHKQLGECVEQRLSTMLGGQ